jgi:hypothetical protein
MDFDLPLLVTALMTFAIVITTVAVHYEGLSGLSHWLLRDPFAPRIRIAALILGQVVLHMIEIWIFAVGYFLLCQKLQFGSLIQMSYPGHELTALVFGDYIYFSAVVYSTLGFGDIAPIGPVRFLTGTEGVMGLVLITWSASFTFMEMQRHWGRD